MGSLTCCNMQEWGEETLLSLSFGETARLKASEQTGGDKTMENRPICDAHVHIFPEKLYNAIYEWFSSRGWHILFRMPPEKKREFLQEMGVRKAFLLVYAHKPGIAGDLNRWLRDFSAASGGFFYPFGCLHPQDRDMGGIVEKALGEFDFCGFKLQLLVNRVRADDERLFRAYEELLERQKGGVIHATTYPVEEEFLGVKYIEKILNRYPGLKLLVPHMGLYEHHIYEELLREYRGLYLDTAFIFGNKRFPAPLGELKEMMLRFPDRILYGSDFPILDHDPREAIRAIKGFQLGEENERRIFWENAQEFINLRL